MEYLFRRLVKGDPALHCRDQRGVGIVDVQVRQVKDPLAQRVVPVQHRKTRADPGDQVVVDCDGYIVREEGGLECRGIVSCPGEVDIGFDRVGKRAGEGVTVCRELRIEVLESVFADGTVRSLQQGGEAALGQFDLLPPVIADFTEGHVDISQLGECLVMTRDSRQREREQAFFLLSKRMLPEPAHPPEWQDPVREQWISKKELESIIREGLDPRSDKGSCLADLRTERLQATVPVEGVCLGAVLGETESGILGEAFRKNIE